VSANAIASIAATVVRALYGETAVESGRLRLRVTQCRGNVIRERTMIRAALLLRAVMRQAGEPGAK